MLIKQCHKNQPSNIPVAARGGAEVALGITIRPFSSIELACAVRQPGPCVLCAKLLQCCCPRT